MQGPMRFSQLDQLNDDIGKRPGIYEIYTNDGQPLKVGIGEDLIKRLKQHAASRQSGLKLKPSGNRDNPGDVESKSSILAKHLYYDGAISDKYDLTTERSRKAFLRSECYFLYQTTASKARARDLERVRENEVSWRYQGDVVKRGADE